MASRKCGKAKFDPEREITDRIITAIEAGTPPWRKPWTGQGGGAPFPLRHNGELYRGINVLTLWLTASEKGYASPFWMTFRQAKEFGAQVRKGEKSTMVERPREPTHSACLDIFLSGLSQMLCHAIVS